MPIFIKVTEGVPENGSELLQAAYIRTKLRFKPVSSSEYNWSGKMLNLSRLEKKPFTYAHYNRSE